MIGSVLGGPRGRYQVLEEIGRGGAGVTFRGQRVEGGPPGANGQPVLIKVLPLRGLPGWKAVELFEREAAALRALSHPSVPAWIDDFVLGGAQAPRGFVLVMELVPGRSLRQIVGAGGLSRAALLEVAADVLEVLDHIHQRTPPLIHRDVNPKNVVVRPDGRAALVDFGSVQAALRDPAHVGQTAAGTFGYAPMEQFLGQATPRSDLYGLGMTLLAALSGQEPEGLPLAGIAVDVAAVVPDDPALARVLAALVDPDPRCRPVSAAEALALLRPLRSVPGAAGTPARPVDALERLARRLGAEGFAVERGGELRQTALAWRARREAQGLRGPPTLVIAAPATALGGPAGRPLAPIPAALFVQAVAATPVEAGGGLRRLLASKALVIALIGAGEKGVDPRTRDHVLHSLADSERAVVIPAVLTSDGALDLWTPRALLAGDEQDHLARARQLLTPA